MLYRNEEGPHPSLLVEDGETVTIGARGDRAAGLSVLKLRPRTTAALMTAAGIAVPAAPRLSDREAFEHVDRIEGLVNLAEHDEDRKIAGYGIPFLRGVLQALDPSERMPARSVQRIIPESKQGHDCGCSGTTQPAPYAQAVTRSVATTDVARFDTARPVSATARVSQSYVPGFLAELKVYSLVTVFADIVIGRNATLVLDSDLNFAMANNVLAYQGARIVQRASYLNLDVRATLRGSLFDIVHTTTDVLKVNWTALAAQPATKP